MRDYGKVHSTFWSSPTIAPLGDDAKLLALYLLTCQHSTIAGVFRMPDGYASEDLEWTQSRVAKGFAELLANGFANRCETTKWVWITKHLKWNAPDNPNQRKAAAKVAATVPDECAWKPEFMRVCGPLLGLESAAEGNPLPTVSEPLGKPRLNQEQKQEQKAGAETGAGRGARASRTCPADFAPTPEMLAWAKSEAPRLDIEHETKTFRLYERSKPVSDWPRAWKAWILKAKGFAGERAHKANGSRNVLHADDIFEGAP